MKKIIFNNKIFVGLVAFFLATTAQIGAKELPSLVLYFDFDSIKGAKIEDLSGKDNHGKIVGKPNIVNGKPFGERNAGFKLQCTAEVPLVVGGGVQRPQYVFEGALDEVAVFNRALSQAEVNEVMEGIGQILSVKAEEKLPITWGKIKNFNR